MIIRFGIKGVKGGQNTKVENTIEFIYEMESCLLLQLSVLLFVLLSLNIRLN